jgi:hypothetical protein
MKVWLIDIFRDGLGILFIIFVCDFMLSQVANTHYSIQIKANIPDVLFE